MLAAHETTYVDEVGFEVHGILHGESKPTNVTVSPSGIPIILDFLLVDVQRLLDPQVIPALKPNEWDEATRALGTPGFMAPEQAEHGIVTVSTDITDLALRFAISFSRTKVRRRLR